MDTIGPLGQVIPTMNMDIMCPLGHAGPNMDTIGPILWDRIGPLWTLLVPWGRLGQLWIHWGRLYPLWTLWVPTFAFRQALPSMCPLAHAGHTMDTMGPLGQARPTMEYGHYGSIRTG